MKLIWEKTKILLIMVGLFLLSQVGLFVAGYFLGLNKLYETGFSPIQTLIVLVIMCASLAFILYYARKQGLLSLKFDFITTKNMKWFAISYGAMWVVEMLGGWLISLEGRVTTDNQDSLNQMMSLLPLAIMFMLVVVIAPIVEEIVFRGMIVKCLFKNHENWGYIISALSFGLMHITTDITSLASWVTYVGMGACITFSYYKTKRLEIPILLHFINNLLAFFIMMST